MANPQLIGTPEKTINGFRSKWNAVESPIVFTISNDKFPTGASVSDYYTEVNIFVNGNNIATVKQIPDSNNETKVDVRKFVKSALSFDLQSVGEDVNATAEVYITGEEKYIDNTGVSQSNPIDNNQGDNDPFYVSLSALQFGNEYGGNMYDYVVDNSKTDLAKWLTTFERGQIVDFVDTTVSALINNQDIDFVVEKYDINGNLLDTVTDSFGVINGLYRFSLSNIQFTIDTNYVVVYLESSSVMLTEYYFVDVDLDCVSSPSAPINLQLLADEVNKAKLSWESTSNGEESGFGIERSIDGLIYILIDTVATGVTDYEDTIGGDVYYYRVNALGGIPSSYSNIVSGYVFEDQDALDWVSNMTSPTINQQERIDAFVVAEKEDGNWQLSDGYWLLDMGPTNSLIGSHGEDLEEVDNGGSNPVIYNSDGVQMSGASGANCLASVNPLSSIYNNYTQNDARVSYYQISATAFQGDTVTNGGWNTSFFAGNSIYFINGTSSQSTSGNVLHTSESLIEITRENGSFISAYKDGVSVDTKADASTGTFSTNKLVLGNDNTFGRPNGGQWSMICLGAQIGFDHAAHNTNVRDYLGK